MKECALSNPSSILTGILSRNDEHEEQAQGRQDGEGEHPEKVRDSQEEVDPAAGRNGESEEIAPGKRQEEVIPEGGRNDSPEEGLHEGRNDGDEELPHQRNEGGEEQHRQEEIGDAVQVQNS